MALGRESEAPAAWAKMAQPCNDGEGDSKQHNNINHIALFCFALLGSARIVLLCVALPYFALLGYA